MPARKPQPCPAKMTEEEINAILARTDWAKYWQDVADAARPELEAYSRAMVSSLADAATKFIREPALHIRDQADL
jgi:hypothetical protein